MNGISDDVLQVDCGNGDSGSRRLRLRVDGSHWLDTLNVSNSNSRNKNNWFVTMIASLHTMANTFAKIFKIVYWIVGDDYCNKKNTCHFSSFRRKICQNGLQKWNLRKKLGNEHLDYKTWKKSTINRKSTVNGPWSTEDDINRWRKHGWCQELSIRLR